MSDQRGGRPQIRFRSDGARGSFGAVRKPEGDSRAATFSSIQKRLVFLHAEAEAEGISLNPNSERDFQAFIDEHPFLRRGSLFLEDDGTLRMVWKKRGDHLGLRFLGKGQVLYVIFKQRAPGEPVSRVTGRDNFRGVEAQIDAFNLLR